MIRFCFVVTPAFFQKFKHMAVPKQKLFADILQNIISEIFAHHATGYRHTIQSTATNSQIVIEIQGVTTFNKVDDSRYIQEISNKLYTLKIIDMFIVGEYHSELQPMDRALSPASIVEVNRHATLKDIFDLDEKHIPEEFFCPITKVVMGNPAFLTTNPLHNYEYSALLKWLNENQTDPMTRSRVELVGVLLNHNLKEKISNFMSDYIKGKDLMRYHTPTREVGTNTESDETKATSASVSAGAKTTFFNPAQATAPIPAKVETKSSLPSLTNLFEVCKMTDEFNALLGKALRRAASTGLNEQIQLIFSKCSNPVTVINLQDNNPATKNTALHIAIQKLQIDVIKLLLRNGAKTDIPNAEGKTADMLMRESSDSRITNIIKEREERDKPIPEPASLPTQST